MGCGSSTASQSAKKEKTAAERKAAWKSIQKRLPREKTPEDKKKRIALFENFDKNDSGKLSLAEVYAGSKEVLKLDEFTTHLYDIVTRAFNKAKDMGNKEEGTGDEDYVEFLEFRLFLCYIYDYFELTVMFDEMDTSGNQILSEKEFVKEASRLREWGIEIEDPETEFKSIDTNGSGSVTFDEFAEWVMARKMKSSGDPDEGVASPQKNTNAVLTSEYDSSAERALPTSGNDPSDLPTGTGVAALSSTEGRRPSQDKPLPSVSESSPVPLTAEDAQSPVANTRAVSIPTAAVENQRTVAQRKAAWEQIKLRLPRAKTPEDKTKRIALFKQFDVNGKKALTIENCYDGCMKVLKLDDFTPAVRDINDRAFNKASSMGNKAEGAGDADMVEFLEFRLFLCYLYDYFELTVMFDEMDESGDMMVDKEEFIAAIPKIAEWGLKIDDPEAAFASVDRNNTGKISFDEFAKWATEMKLDADGK